MTIFEVKNMPKTKETEDVFEQMFESQVHEFVEQHLNIINEESNVFKMAKKFEDRYDFVISKTKERVNIKISEVRKQNHNLYLKITQKRISLIENEMEKLKEDIEKSLEEHNEISSDQEEILSEIFTKKKSEILNDILNELSFKFL